ncbi:uncharacterized protein LOC110713470 [Chenopodium quinoa]|uniref:uncharacterized protein LOC110713470 n=1 Tax=Chenopodium quinoa TaxID=63459 RepID=UPI000B77B9BA|nr:uncharacterized protein LOC110713470 [Chenopodium quinoa]
MDDVYESLPNFSVLCDEDNDRVMIPSIFRGVMSDMSGSAHVYRGLDTSQHWGVFVTEVEENVNMVTYIENGWKVFVTDNDIQFDDELVIYYGFSGKFNCRVIRGGVDITVVEENMNNENDHGDTIVVDDNNLIELETRKQRTKQRLGRMIFQSRKVAFGVTLTSTYIEHGNMNVPVKFARENFVGLAETNRVTLTYKIKRWDADLHIVKGDTRGELKIVLATLKRIRPMMRQMKLKPCHGIFFAYDLNTPDLFEVRFVKDG